MKTPRRSLLLVLPVLAFPISACGGPGDGNVASIAADPTIEISDAEYKRNFNATLAQVQQKPVSEVYPLDAPQFTKCIEQKKADLPEGSQRSSTAELKTQCQDEYDQVRTNAFGNVVQAYWVVAEARRQGIPIRQAAVTRDLDSVVQAQFEGDRSKLTDFLKQTGLNEQDINLTLRRNIADQAIIAKLQEGLEPPTAQEVRSYFAQNKQQYVTPETRDLRIVKTSSEAQAAAAKQALEAGQSWKDVAAKYSTDDATKDNGGAVIGTTADAQPPEFTGTVFKADKGELLGPLRSSLGWYVVKVQNITPEQQPDFEQLKPQLEQQLQQDQQQKATQRFVTLFQARWAARTDCASEFDDLVFCGGTDANATTPEQLPAPPGSGVPQFPVPEVDPNAALGGIPGAAGGAGGAGAAGAAGPQ